MMRTNTLSGDYPRSLEHANPHNPSRKRRRAEGEFEEDDAERGIEEFGKSTMTMEQRKSQHETSIQQNPQHPTRRTPTVQQLLARLDNKSKLDNAMTTGHNFKQVPQNHPHNHSMKRRRAHEEFEENDAEMEIEDLCQATMIKRQRESQEGIQHSTRPTPTVQELLAKFDKKSKHGPQKTEQNSSQLPQPSHPMQTCPRPITNAQFFGRQKSYLPRPFFTYTALCAMAIHNSPDGHVTCNMVYEFILYHFPLFYNLKATWKASVRSALTRQTHWFHSRKDESSKIHKYGFIPGISMKDCFNDACWQYMRTKDSRGFEYYEKILQGQDQFLAELQNQ